MTVRLIATDMDGTFLDGQGSFDRERFSRVLEKLEEKQIPFVIASGNGIGRLLQLCQGFEDRLIFVADNGAHVYQNGKTVIRRAIQQVEVEAILHFFKGRWAEVCLMLSTEKNIYMQAGAGVPFAGTDLPIEPAQMAAFQSRVSYLDDLSVYPISEQIYKIGLWVPEARVDKVTEEFNQVFQGQLVAVTSGYGSVDILPQGIHKAWGMEQVLISLDIEPNQVMAFGDSDNDIELLSYVGYSYAMENATDKVKAVAKYMAPSHLEAGVLQVLEELVL
ncbi:Cof-type HAD-IIB family hydrolase [Streptococcus suis]|uniref:Cof-type HAD-IIB family hydrolase n=1 Tax=Streptococcus suis TaxID=1307 RepID=UPI001C96F1B9|nr:Cof-type HAD-IIB family hydrolase [Streptococcus suis]MBY4961169.1 Cof-type HAD-IIB family hydrolase [Streptococcus suis]MBY4967492.1 Cof-type HAD-IIB family hydrolase [Streptococcus suis]MBY4978566.1 Cof-type HAD-IIB family hydrolase [Streptococcus suis]MBY4987075.1 Cof-type HAD-IIB family hydrolase [Streptococcus suis]MBY4993733.1 Cof-type HAD-IIB family hydrolase [Streptococcus suis]